MIDRRLPPGSHRSQSPLTDHGSELPGCDSPIALGAFSRDLLDEDPEVRLQAATALAWMLDARAISPLVRALRDVEWDVRLAAAEGLLALSPVPDWAFELVAQRADDPEAAVRAAVMTVIAYCERVDSLPSLIAGASDPDREVATAAAHGLQHLGRLGITSRDAAETLVRRLARESDPHVAYALFWALGWQGGKRFELQRSEWRYSRLGRLAWQVVAGAP